MKNSISNRLQELIDHIGITQDDLATSIGIDKSNVNKWFRGKAVPRKSSLKKIVDVYGCTPLWLSKGIGLMFGGGIDDGNSVHVHQSSTGSGISIQAGRDAKKNIVESGAGGLSNEEQELIYLIRQYGGSKTIESFKERLLKIKNLLEDN